jgi:tetratricopeptide (TPR) repeat protein
MKIDTEGLHEIANTSNADRQADIVFVHGLGGSSHETWRHGKEADADHYFWPAELGRVLPDCGIWSFGYAAGITGMGNPGMSIVKRGGNFASQLVAAGVGDRPVVFIVHSMGGLIVKSLIASRESLDDDRRRVVQNTRGIVFCGTPHRGSDYVRAAMVLGMVTRGVQGHVKQMKSSEESLDHLHDAFLAWARNSQTKVVTFAEGIGLWRKNWLRRMAQLKLVVERASANTGCGTIHDTDADHLSLVKLTPSVRAIHDIVFFHTRKLVEDILQANGLDSTTDSKPPPAEQPSDHSTNPQKGSVQSQNKRSRVRRIAPSRILRHSPPKLFGREAWLDALDEAWKAGDAVNIYTLVAWGGVGKTSVVAHWVNERFARLGWPGVDRYFDWSFYSQGTGEARQTSSDPFINAALKFFGDPEPMKGSPWERGERLVSLIRQHRTLLVLDGIEPLQYSIGDPQAGLLKDQALEAVVQGLATDNQGLCVVMTREHLANVESLVTANEVKLDRLPTEAGVALFRHLGIRGSDRELEAACDEAGGHALTLQLLGHFLAEAHGGDISKRTDVTFDEMDAAHQGRSAFSVMRAYERWLETADQSRQRELAILRLTGLFDRPISDDCAMALIAAPAIPKLTDTLVDLPRTEWRIALNRLCSIDLVTRLRDDSEQNNPDRPFTVHPLVREYFANRMKHQMPNAFRAAHSRIFDHLCETTIRWPNTIEGLQPLYQAVTHGCLAGRQMEACNNVLVDRIFRGTGTGASFSGNALGATSANLACLANFFDKLWTKPTEALSKVAKGWLIGEAGFYLRAVGRLIDALPPLQVALEMSIKAKNWVNVTIVGGNMADVLAKLGRLNEALAKARDAITHADRTGDMHYRSSRRSHLGYILHSLGDRDGALLVLTKAESLATEENGDSYLAGVGGFYVCERLLRDAEIAMWRVIMQNRGCINAIPTTSAADSIIIALGDIHKRSAKTRASCRANGAPILTLAFEEFNAARTALMRAVLHPDSENVERLEALVASALVSFQEASHIDEIPRVLLLAATLRLIIGDAGRSIEALNRAWQVSERSRMRLFLADVHLHRARLFHWSDDYPWSKSPDGSPRGPADDLAAAEKIINECGYHRRDEELADAKQVILGSNIP